MKYAITGSSGFIGRYLLKRLSSLQGIKIIKFDRERHSLLNPESLKDLVEEQDVIFHLAGKNKGENKELLETNTLGTFCLLEAIRKFNKKGAKIIFASSFAVYKVNLNPGVLREDSPLEPSNIYGLSKLFAEEIIKFYAQKLGMKGIILRLANVYGPGCPPFRQSVVSTIATLIKEGKTITINGDGTQTRDFVYVEDVAEAFVRAANFRPQKFGIFNICSGKDISLNELIKKMEHISGKRAKIRYLIEKTREEKGYWRGSNKKAKSILGWEPKTTLEAGLKSLF